MCSVRDGYRYSFGAIDISKVPDASPARRTNINRFVRDFRTESGVFVQNSVCDKQKKLRFARSQVPV